MDQAKRFKSMYACLGLSVADVARFLQVTPRTVQAWISGRTRIPYAAYKLLRLQLRYELPGDAWQGWHLSAGRLYTPEGFELNPHEFTWWSLLVRQARCFRSAYEATKPPAPSPAISGALAPTQGPGSGRDGLVTRSASLTSETCQQRPAFRKNPSNSTT